MRSSQAMGGSVVLLAFAEMTSLGKGLKSIAAIAYREKEEEFNSICGAARCFPTLHYLSHWHCGILCGLKVAAQAGFIRDKGSVGLRDLPQSNRLPDSVKWRDAPNHPH
jgi:hypothetical protein